MKKNIILSVFIIGIFFSGCIDSISNKKIDTINTLTNNITTLQDEQFISETFDDIHEKYNNECNKMTQYQCKEWIKSYNGKYINWSGIINDVTNEVIYTKLNDKIIILHDISKKELIKFNKGDKISFTGKIVIKDYDAKIPGTDIDMPNSVIFGSNFYSLNLYDVRITEINRLEFVTLQWKDSSVTTPYTYQISTDYQFFNIVASGTATSSSILKLPLVINKKYYLRVITKSKELVYELMFTADSPSIIINYD